MIHVILFSQSGLFSWLPIFFKTSVFSVNNIFKLLFPSFLFLFCFFDQTFLTWAIILIRILFFWWFIQKLLILIIFRFPKHIFFIWILILLQLAFATKFLFNHLIFWIVFAFIFNILLWYPLINNLALILFCLRIIHYWIFNIIIFAATLLSSVLLGFLLILFLHFLLLLNIIILLIGFNKNVRECLLHFSLSCLLRVLLLIDFDVLFF